MGEIARRLGVAKPTLYRMAGSREELIAISVDAEAERLLEQIHRRGARGVLRFRRATRPPVSRCSSATATRARGRRCGASRTAWRRRSSAGPARRSAEIAAAGLLGLAAGLARRAVEDGARPSKLNGSVQISTLWRNWPARISDAEA